MAETITRLLALTDLVSRGEGLTVKELREKLGGIERRELYRIRERLEAVGVFVDTSHAKPGTREKLWKLDEEKSRGSRLLASGGRRLGEDETRLLEMLLSLVRKNPALEVSADRIAACLDITFTAEEGDASPEALAHRAWLHAQMRETVIFLARELQVKSQEIQGEDSKKTKKAKKDKRSKKDRKGNKKKKLEET